MKKCLIIFLVLLAGCSWLRPDPIIQTKTIEVKVPVYLKAEPPSFLSNRQKYVLPDFHAPMTQDMTSCLNIEGEEKLKRLLLNLRDKERAWKKWAE